MQAPDHDPVLRLPDVRASRESLESALRVRLFRYEASRKGSGCYAQVNFRYGATWAEVSAELRRMGSALQRAVERGEIGRPRLDIGLYLPTERFSRSLVLPPELCEAVGRHGIELEISVYPGSVEDEPTRG